MWDGGWSWSCLSGGGLRCRWVGGLIGACTGAGVCTGLSRCAASGLYRHGDNKLIQVMFKLSGENLFFSVFLSARAANPIPVAAYGASENRRKPPQLSAERAPNVEGDDNGLRYASLFFFFVFFFLFPSITNGMRIHLPVTVMRSVCSIQPVCFTQTEVDARTNPGASRCEDGWMEKSIKLKLI